MQIKVGAAMNDNITDRTVYTGRPKASDPIPPDMRLSKEIAVYDLLDSLGIPYTRIDHAPIATIEGCQEVDKLLQISLCKNLFLCNSQKTTFHLLVMPGDKRFVTKDFSKQIGSARLSFAPEKFMEQYLDITPGSVSILGLMNDKEHCVSLSIDQDVLREEYLGCHPCINTSSLRLPMRDILEKFLPYTGHTYQIVTL
jgi:Ala-tRNA(Pro) deacylase